MIWLNWCINYISGQTTGLDHRSACSFPFWQCSLSWQRFPVVYPKVVLTVVFITTVVYILTVVSSLSDYSPNSYFHVIFISAYPAVRVQFYAYVQWFNLNLLFAGKESSQQACDHRYNYTKGRNQRRSKNYSFGKGFDVLKDHVLNRLMTGRCQSKSLQLRPKFHSLFLQNSFDFQKSATFKTLQSSPRMYWCKFQPWKRRLLHNKKNRQTDRHTDKVTTVTLSRMRAAEG